jgi:catechol 2,3-dioxygenase-like lactoylglutathione lyase family enzyme
MSIRRVVPDITTDNLDRSRDFYVGLLGFEVAMDMGWIMTLASPTNPTAQISIMQKDQSSPLQPHLTIEVEDVDAVYTAALQRGVQIVYPITDEAWGVRRFFMVDPNGMVINVVRHRRNPPTPE